MNDKLKGMWNNHCVLIETLYPHLCGRLRKAMNVSVLPVSRLRLESTTSQYKSKSFQLP
jgi:hypothetical protein